MSFAEFLNAFITDGRVITLLVLILLDVALGIAAAIKENKFDPKKVAQFYRTMIIPYVIGYLAIWGAGLFLNPAWLGEEVWIVGDGLRWSAWLAIITTLTGSITVNLKIIGILPAKD